MQVRKIDTFRFSEPWTSQNFRERVEKFNDAAHDFNEARERLRVVLDTVRQRDATTGFLKGGGRMLGNEINSWVQPGTFKSAESLLNRIESIQAERLRIPIEGERLLSDYMGLFQAMKAEVDAHRERLQGALSTAKQKAREEVEGYAGLSDSARAAHVTERTIAQADACAEFEESLRDYPFRVDDMAVAELRGELVQELRAAIANRLGANA